MIAIALLSIIALSGVMLSLSFECRRLARDVHHARQDLHNLRQALRHGSILPDSKGFFRLMVPIRAIGGFADGEVRFAPVGKLPEEIAFEWTDEHDVEHLTTYQISENFSNGAHEARPLANH